MTDIDGYLRPSDRGPGLMVRGPGLMVRGPGLMVHSDTDHD